MAMSIPFDCEKYVIEKLISILSKSLNCQMNRDSEESNDALIVSENEVSLLQKALQVLKAQNETFVIQTVITKQDFGDSSQNSTDADSMILHDDGEVTTTSSVSSRDIFSIEKDGVLVFHDDLESTGMNKLHKLEMIKVFVLIFVISIILLTTCRMVFQLFIRFRPEKPTLA